VLCGTCHLQASGHGAKPNWHEDMLHRSTAATKMISPQLLESVFVLCADGDVWFASKKELNVSPELRAVGKHGSIYQKIVLSIFKDHVYSLVFQQDLFQPYNIFLTQLSAKLR
jgi:hypothetical protein